MKATHRHSYFFDLVEACQSPGCAICTLVAQTRWRYLDSLAYESVNDLAIRARLRESLGFCNRHAWYFVENVRDAFGTAIIYRDVLHTIQRATASSSLDSALGPTADCLACAIERESAQDALLTLSEGIDVPDLRTALTKSDGLCGPHLLRGLTIASRPTRQSVLELIERGWDRKGSDTSWLRSCAVGARGTFSADSTTLLSAPSHTTAALTELSVATKAAPFECSVCNALSATFEQLSTWTELADGHASLCNVHSWLPLGNTCPALYQRQIAAIRAKAREAADASDGIWLRQAIRGLGLSRPQVRDVSLPLPCVACAAQSQIEDAHCRTTEGLLCVPHLRRAAMLGRGDLLALAQPTWRELDHLLGEYIRKEDYRFRHEPRGMEVNSPRWAVALLSGAPNLR